VDQFTVLVDQLTVLVNSLTVLVDYSIEKMDSFVVEIKIPSGNCEYRKQISKTFFRLQFV
jgi:hypothetical protein